MKQVVEFKIFPVSSGLWTFLDSTVARKHRHIHSFIGEDIYIYSYHYHLRIFATITPIPV